MAGVALHIMITAGCGSNSGGSSSDSVASTAAACISCHSSAVSPVTGLNIATEWQASTHSTQNAASCYDCHEPDPTHPSNCNLCHGGGTLSTESARHDVSTNPDADDKCKKCHGIEATRAQTGSVYGFSTAALFRAHFNNITASFVSTRYRKNCRKCHNPHNPTGHISINQEWKQSGHGNNYEPPWNYRNNFKTQGTAGANPATTYGKQCVRCHTATGYINYVSSNFTDISPWGLAEYNAGDKTNQVLACNACHDDGNGNTYAFKRRSVPQVTAYYAYSTVYTKKFVLSHQFPDLATSNICMSCHTGREIGAVITEAKNRGFSNFSTSLINSHYLTGGATVFKISGYEYSGPGRSYENNSNYAHDRIGIGNYNSTGSDGPCVTCHLKPKRHSFLPVVKSGTTITSVVSTVCANCHPGGWQTTDSYGVLDLQLKKAGYLAAIEALKQQIKAKNYNVNTTGSQDWERAYGAAGGPNTMGAFFNYYLLSHDYGGFAHNSRYVKRLLYDSIDWMYDGILDADDVESAIENLYSLGKLTLQQKTDAIDYILGGSGSRP